VRICFDIGGAFYPGASDETNALVLQHLLECLVGINKIFLASHPRTPKLYQSGVRYVRTEVWDSIPDLYKRRYGDCKSLTAAYVAELRMAKQQATPVFRFMTNPRTGQKDFHILVQRGKVVEDPSRVLGMDQYHAMMGTWAFPQ